MGERKMVRGSILRFVFLFTTSMSIVVNKVNAGCTESMSGKKITCEDDSIGEQLSLSMELKLCRVNPKIKVKLDVDAFDLHVEEEGSELAIPVKLAKVILSLESSSNDGEFKISVKISLPIIPDITIYSQNARDNDCNVVMQWLNSQGMAVLIAIGAGVLLFIIGCCCCCYRCCCRKNYPTSFVVMNPPSMMAGFPVVQTGVPYDRQMNEI